MIRRRKWFPKFHSRYRQIDVFADECDESADLKAASHERIRESFIQQDPIMGASEDETV